MHMLVLNVTITIRDAYIKFHSDYTIEEAIKFTLLFCDTGMR